MGAGRAADLVARPDRCSGSWSGARHGTLGGPELDAQKTVLPSGLCVVSVTMPDRHSVSAGVWLRSGARHGPPGWLGISHLIEHRSVKGTARRDARAIARSLESLGGHLDAFTSREQVCYYARVLSEHLPQAIDVLADIVCHSQFADAEL